MPAGGDHRSRLQLRDIAPGINSPLAAYDETFLVCRFFHYLRACLARGGATSLGGVHHPGGWTVDVSVGKVQGRAARSLVGELCAGRAPAHRTVTRRARAGR